jgi:hypothetical protein
VLTGDGIAMRSQSITGCLADTTTGGVKQKRLMRGGAPAQLLTMQCVAGSGSLVETAVTIHAGTAFVLTAQNQAGAIANHRADRAAFRNFLAGIRLQR